MNDKELILSYLNEQLREWNYAAGELRMCGPHNGIWNEKWEKDVEYYEINAELVRLQITQLLSE